MRPKSREESTNIPTLVCDAGGIPPRPRRHVARRVAQIVTGQAFLKGASWIFDNPLYLFVIYRFGALHGGLIMMVLSALICISLLIVYEQMKVDWLGVNVLETVKERGGLWVNRLYYTRPVTGRIWFRLLVAMFRVVAFVPCKIFLAVVWALNKGDAFAFVALSLYEDPFVTTAFLRHGKFDGLCARDWGVFFCSVVLSNGYWILRSFVIVQVAKETFRVFVE